MAHSWLLIDERDGLLRAGLFSSGRLVDLLLDDCARPLPYGLVLDSRLDRILPGDNGSFLKDAAGTALYMRGKAPGQPGDVVSVQIKAEAGHGKAARVGADISVPGRRVVYLPGGKGVHRSRRLGRANQGRDDLSAAIAELSAMPGGWLLRRGAAQADAGAIRAEAEALLAESATLSGGATGAVPLDLRLWLAELPAMPDEIECCEPWLTEALGHWLGARGYGGVSLATVPGSGDRLDEAIAPLGQQSVACAGGRVHIEATRALTAIDIDTGSGGDGSHIDSLIAEAARQIRLRNLSGAIAIDVPNRAADRDPDGGLDRLKRAVADDTVPVHVFGLSRLGFLELIRERRRRSLEEILTMPQEQMA